jgi:hypothetical protein
LIRHLLNTSVRLGREWPQFEVRKRLMQNSTSLSQHGDSGRAQTASSLVSVCGFSRRISRETLPSEETTRSSALITETIRPNAVGDGEVQCTGEP